MQPRRDDDLIHRVANGDISSISKLKRWFRGYACKPCLFLKDMKNMQSKMVPRPTSTWQEREEKKRQQSKSTNPQDPQSHRLTEERVRNFPQNCTRQSKIFIDKQAVPKQSIRRCRKAVLYIADYSNLMRSLMDNMWLGRFLWPAPPASPACCTDRKSVV